MYEREYSALPEDWSSVPNTHTIGQLKVACNFSSRESDTISDLLRHLQSCVHTPKIDMRAHTHVYVCTCTHVSTHKHMHKDKINLKTHAYICILEILLSNSHLSMSTMHKEW